MTNGEFFCMRQNMVKIDLITGFLGSGKTTFIKKYGSYLMEKGENLGILENDFGAVNVDRMLLSDLQDAGCDVEMVSGGCDYDCHKRRFKTKLIAMGMLGYDRILVEPSGIFDTDEFFDVLEEEPLNRWYEIGNVIAIADVTTEQNLSEKASALLAAQLARAGIVVLSKTSTEQTRQNQSALAYFQKLMEQFGSRQKLAEKTLAEDWENMDETQWEQIRHSGYAAADVEIPWFEKEDAFDSVYLLEPKASPEQIRQALPKLFDSGEAGRVFRVKGFYKEKDQWYEVNATKKKTEIRAIDMGQSVLIVIGENLQEEWIRQQIEFKTGCKSEYVVTNLGGTGK